MSPLMPRPDELPGALTSMWRLFKLGYHHEPRLLVTAFVLSLLAALPDALIALWLALLGKGVVEGTTRLVMAAAVGLGVSATLTWLLRVISSRLQRRFRDKVTIALEGHVAGLQARVVTVAHQERPDYLDRLAVLRDQIFVLDHLYMSVFSTCGWILRLAVTIVLLMSIHWTLALLVLAALPTVLTSGWRPGVERRVQEEAAQHQRRAAHYYRLATTAPSARELRVLGLGERIAAGRRTAWESWYAPTARVRWAQRPLAHRWRGPSSALGFVARGRLGDQRARRPRRPGAAGARRRWTAVGVRRRDGRRDRLPARCLARRLAAAGLAGGLRGRSSAPATWRRPPGSSPASASTASPSPTREPATGWCSRTSTWTCPRGPWSRWWARTAPASRPSSSCSPRCTCPPPAGSSSTTSRWRTSTPSTGGTGWPARSRTSTASSWPPSSRSASATCPASTTRTPRRRPWAGPAPTTWSAGWRTGLATQLGPHWPGGVDLSFGQWQKLALARGFMREHPLLLVLDEPTAALDAETEHALFERFAAAARTEADRRPHHRAGLAPVLDRADGRPDRGARRGARSSRWAATPS